MNRVNPHLDEIRYKLAECFHKLKGQNGHITAEAIKRLYTGEDKTNNSLLSLFEYHSLNAKGVLKWGTLKNYGATKKFVKKFLKERYRSDDIDLCELNYQFITNHSEGEKLQRVKLNFFLQLHQESNNDFCRPHS